LGVSIDSVHCHKGWSASLGGITFPLLADFQPKGDMALDYGVFLDEPGMSDRATFLVDANGIVQFSEAVGPGGERSPAEMLAKAQAL
jgi:alkyl hydroperoxide reductase subunit AhpC